MAILHKFIHVRFNCTAIFIDGTHYLFCLVHVSVLVLYSVMYCKGRELTKTNKLGEQSLIQLTSGKYRETGYTTPLKTTSIQEKDQTQTEDLYIRQTKEQWD